MTIYVLLFYKNLILTDKYSKRGYVVGEKRSISIYKLWPTKRKQLAGFFRHCKTMTSSGWSRYYITVFHIWCSHKINVCFIHHAMFMRYITTPAVIMRSVTKPIKAYVNNHITMWCNMNHISSSINQLQ